jgi:hypothetical protein
MKKTRACIFRTRYKERGRYESTRSCPTPWLISPVIIFVKGGVSTHPCLLEPQVSTTTLPIKCLLEGRDFSNLNSSNIVFQKTGKEMGHTFL